MKCLVYERASLTAVSLWMLCSGRWQKDHLQSVLLSTWFTTTTVVVK